MTWIKGWPTWVKWTVGIVLVLIIVGAIVGEGEEKDKSESSTAVAQKDGDDNTSGGTSDPPAASSEDRPPETTVDTTEEADDGCGNEATDDCTPHVGAKGSVQVDGLVWKLRNVKTAAAIGDQQYGLGEKANGIYLIADLEVTSTKDESVTITEEVVQLIADEGNSYATDSDGTLAALGEGQETFLFEDIGPNSTREGVVVFDVPKSLLQAKLLELEFGELGFGETHGYIALPKLG